MSTRTRHVRRLAPLIAVLLMLTLISPVSGAGANAEPETQQHAHGVASVWNLTWSGDAPFDYNFHYGDGFVRVRLNTFAVAENGVRRTFFPCSTTTFTQWFRVWDSDAGYAYDFTTAKETGGNPC